MTVLSPSPIPWQVTGNHWLSLPCIHPADASVHAIGVLHRGARSALEYAGQADFVGGGGPALLRPALEIDGKTHSLASVPIAWERALGWIPTFTCTIADLLIRGTVFAPYGRDADIAGVVYALSIENRSGEERDLVVALHGTLGARQLRVRSGKPFDDAPLVSRADGGTLVLEGSSSPGLAALALTCDADPDIAVESGTFTMRRRVHIGASSREHVAFYVAAAPERDGAIATAAVLRRRGWRDLIAATRESLQALEQSTGHEGLDRLINANLLFTYFYSVGRALDDSQFYIVRSRSPSNGWGVTIRDWEALSWVIPAIQLADPPLARELLLRMCELHGYAPGRGMHYLDGTVFEPGFMLEGVAAYAIATDRYIRDTGDDRIVDEPVLADTLYLSAEDLETRRDARMPLYTTELMPSGVPAPQPFLTHGNAAAAQALDILRRTLDEESAKKLEDPEAVRAAIRRHLVVDDERASGRAGTRSVFAAAADLAGATSLSDDPVGSLFWLPLYDAVPRQDSTYRRTVKALTPNTQSLAQQCARLMGPDSKTLLQWFRRAPLDSGLAAQFVDEEGRATGNGGDAALAGLVAWSIWYAVNALGEQP